MPRVLIVDDEESIRFSYKKFLTDSGYDVAVTSHLLEAKALLPANEFAVAIVDRILGDDNGMDLVKHIRKTQPFCEPILISAYPVLNPHPKPFNMMFLLTLPSRS